MFGSNSRKGRGSLRKAFCKQTTRPNTSANESSTSTKHNESRENGQLKQRPPALTFSDPSGVEKCDIATVSNNLPISLPITDGHSLPPAYPKIHSAPADTKIDPTSLINRPRFSSVKWGYNPAESIANTPLVENIPLTVDVACECGIPSTAQSQSDPPSIRSTDQHRLQPNSLGGQQQNGCRIHGHQHYRSISASPHTGINHPMNAPLLIPLGNSWFPFIYPPSCLIYPNYQELNVPQEHSLPLAHVQSYNNIAPVSADLFICVPELPLVPIFFWQPDWIIQLFLILKTGTLLLTSVRFFIFLQNPIDSPSPMGGSFPEIQKFIYGLIKLANIKVHLNY
jgi:hypothetical protein